MIFCHRNNLLKGDDYMGKTVVITAGGTNERIDEVRKITNMSTGELGYRICHELIKQKLQLIDMVYYICPRNVRQPKDIDKVEIINANDTFSVKKEVESLLFNKKVDYFIHSMAVSDYTTDYVSNAQNLAREIASVVSENKMNTSLDELSQIIEDAIRNHKHVIDRSSKISSAQDNLLIKLKPTPKIISRIKKIQPSTFLVGFKLLNGVSKGKLYNVAHALLQKNGCDLVVVNDLADIRKGQHTAMFIKPDGTKEFYHGKDQIAKSLIERMWALGKEY